MRVKIVQWNLFENARIRTDPFELTTSLIATRIYLLLLGLSVMTLIGFSASRMRIESVTIRNLSAENYESLYQNYPMVLHCPCSQVAIPYGSFVSLSPTYHPVCSSLFISPEWINSIVGTVNLNFAYSYIDFHVVGQAFFTTVATLCSLSQGTLSDAWYIFNHSTIISTELLSNKELLARTNFLLDQFESNTKAEFKRLLSLIRLHTQTLFSTTRNNADLYTEQLINSNTQVSNILSLFTSQLSASSMVFPEK